MTTTIEYLDAIKSKTGVPSDYAIAKVLGITRASVSNYRNGHTYFDDDICVKVASILEIPEIEVVLNIHAERSTNVIVKASFKEVLKQLGTVAATLLIASGINLSTPSPANAGAASSGLDGAQNDVYYVKY